MNEITRRIWDRGLNLEKWSDLNNFKYRYVVYVLTGVRGRWNVGVAKKIKETLINQGIAKLEDFERTEQ